VLSPNSELVREQLIRKIEDSFSFAISTERTAKLSIEELIHIFEFILEGYHYE
jgi:GntR family transcriptional regulator